MAANETDKPKKIGKISIRFEGFKDETSIRQEIQAAFSPGLAKVLIANRDLRGTLESCVCSSTTSGTTYCECNDPNCY
jgi:hypothetical protein